MSPIIVEGGRDQERQYELVLTQTSAPTFWDIPWGTHLLAGCEASPDTGRYAFRRGRTPKAPSSAGYMSLSQQVRDFLERVLGERSGIPDTRTLPDDVKEFLGQTGLYALRRVLSVLGRVAVREGWPLKAVQVKKVSDQEVEGFEYALVVLTFLTSFEKADTILQGWYKDLQVLADSLPSASKDALIRHIYFDIEVQ